ncbi:MAG: hypothetical protein GF308_19500 [Candidatus Heimdallarchaeota archaeon]|nr:hypothetical protein [Candidatus Heimdallarchaeota archaeon]
MFNITRNEMKYQLKEFFKVKYRGAGGIRISAIQEVFSSSEIAMFSFNLKCKYKREPYDLHFYIRFYLTKDGIERAQNDFPAFEKFKLLKFKIPKIPVVRYVEGVNDYFPFPFLIIQYYPTISLLELLRDPKIEEKKEFKDLLARLDLLPGK